MSANQKIYNYIQLKEACLSIWYYDVNASCFFCTSEPSPEWLFLCKGYCWNTEMSFCRYVSKWVTHCFVAFIFPPFVLLELHRNV